MANFFNFPRELRDMIYMEVLTWSRPLPTIEDTESISGWCRPWEPKSGLGDHGCAFSSKRAPNTCANFLACNRQVNEEMMCAIERARQRGLLAARIDCIAKDEMHYFTWLSIPIVKTEKRSCEVSGKNGIIPSWVVRYLTAPHHALSTTRSPIRRSSSTTIEQLWVDMRLFETASSRANRIESPRDRISWAICAALKHVFEHDPDIIPTRDCQNDVTVGEVVLNVVPPALVPKSTTTYYVAQPPDSDPILHQTKDSVADPEAVAKELVEVWNKLWSGDEFKARYYRNLLERIKRVRVCVEGVTFRVRELGLELQRGRDETRRIEMRMR